MTIRCEWTNFPSHFTVQYEVLLLKVLFFVLTRSPLLLVERELFLSLFKFGNFCIIIISFLQVGRQQTIVVELLPGIRYCTSTV